MSGVFAEWQPRYAQHRVATFPVENKIPCVRNWKKVGLRASTQLALKFAASDAFGFQCGNGQLKGMVELPVEGVQHIL